MNALVNKEDICGKKRSMQAICKALFDHLEQTSGEEVSYDDLVSDHIGKGRTTLTLYLKSLHTSPLFREDGLDPNSLDIPAFPTVEELLVAIFDHYKANNWLVYYA